MLLFNDLLTSVQGFGAHRLAHSLAKTGVEEEQNKPLSSLMNVIPGHGSSRARTLS
jgi:hypothetical protein